jgi:hypothetical protein
MEPIGNHETSDLNHFTQHNNPEDRRIEFKCRGNLRPHTLLYLIISHVKDIQRVSQRNTPFVTMETLVTVTQQQRAVKQSQAHERNTVMTMIAARAPALWWL